MRGLETNKFDPFRKPAKTRWNLRGDLVKTQSAVLCKEVSGDSMPERCLVFPEKPSTPSFENELESLASALSDVLLKYSLFFLLAMKE